MQPHATPLRKPPLWPPNISDKHVSCIAPATWNTSLQILFQCPTPAIVFGNATKPSRFLTFDKVHNPLRLPRETASERPRVVRTRQFFALLTSKYASRHNGVRFFDMSTSKSAHGVEKKQNALVPALHSTFHFWRMSCRIASFLMFPTWKIEEVLRTCCTSDVVKIKNWGSLPV